MNKNSKEFDQELLNSLVSKKISISSFEDELQKIFKRKSRDLGKSVFVYVKEKLRGDNIFMPIAWKEED